MCSFEHREGAQKNTFCHRECGQEQYSASKLQPPDFKNSLIYINEGVTILYSNFRTQDLVHIFQA